MAVVLCSIHEKLFEVEQIGHESAELDGWLPRARGVRPASSIDSISALPILWLSSPLHLRLYCLPLCGTIGVFNHRTWSSKLMLLISAHNKLCCMQSIGELKINCSSICSNKTKTCTYWIRLRSLLLTQLYFNSFYYFIHKNICEESQKTGLHKKQRSNKRPVQSTWNKKKTQQNVARLSH
jgi:hypothetical protein